MKVAIIMHGPTDRPDAGGDPIKSRVMIFPCSTYDKINEGPWTKKRRLGALGPGFPSRRATSDHRKRPIPRIQSTGDTPRCCQLIDMSDAAIAK